MPGAIAARSEQQGHAAGDEACGDVAHGPVAPSLENGGVGESQPLDEVGDGAPAGPPGEATDEQDGAVERNRAVVRTCGGPGIHAVPRWYPNGRSAEGVKRPSRRSEGNLHCPNGIEYG